LGSVEQGLRAILSKRLRARGFVHLQLAHGTP
jgi:hypothetical protein